MPYMDPKGISGQIFGNKNPKPECFGHSGWGLPYQKHILGGFPLPSAAGVCVLNTKNTQVARRFTAFILQNMDNTQGILGI